MKLSTYCHVTGAFLSLLVGMNAHIPQAHCAPAVAGATSGTKNNNTVPTAQEFGAKLLGTPCRVINHSGNKLVMSPPGLDRSVLAFNSNTPGGAGAAAFLDYRSGKSTVVPLPVGSGGWDIMEIAPGKLLFESLWPLSLVMIDTTGGNYKVESSVTVPNNTYAWQFAKGKDGGIYFGSYPGARLHRYDPTTREVREVTKIGPEENLYLRFLAIDQASGLLICATGMTKSQIVAYNIESGQQTLVGEMYPSAMRSAHGQVYAIVANKLLRFDAGQMKMLPVTDPAPPAGQEWKFLAKSSTPDQLLIGTDSSEWYSVSADGKAVPVWKRDLRGGEVVGLDGATGKVLGVRGQGYFASMPLAEQVEWHRVTENPPPVGMHFITADPQGGVTGGPGFGQTLFRFDPARKLAENTDQVVDGGGEVYDGLWRDGKFYFVAYSGGYMGVWDPQQPWDQWANKNPRTIVRYSAPEYGSLIRPIGGVVEGPGGKLYSGWVAAYGRAGGRLTEFDPATEKSRVWTDKHFVPQASIGKVAADERYVYGTTSNYANGIKVQNKPIEFWAFDPQSEKVIFRQQTPGLTFKIPGSNRVYLAGADGVRQFDAQKMAFTALLPWPSSIGKAKSISAVDASGNTAWIVADNHIVKLTTTGKPKLEVLFQVEKSTRVAAGQDGQFYFTQGAELWAVPQ